MWFAFSARSQEDAVRRHESARHWCDQFRRFDGLAGFPAEHLGIILTLWAYLTGVMFQRHALGCETVIRATR